MPGPQGAARQLAAGRARIAGVDAGVDQAVERHREAARADHRDRDPERSPRAGHAVDGEERADVRERQREDRVLELDEREEEPRVAERRRLVMSAGARSARPASSPSAWPSAGRSTSKPSRQPPGEPGRLTTSVEPTTPATPRERRPCGVFAIESARTASAIPGATRSSTSVVASGVTSRGPKPVPPVVRTTWARAGELAQRRGDRGALVGNDPPLDLVALLGEQLREARRRCDPRARPPRRRPRRSGPRLSGDDLLRLLERGGRPRRPSPCRSPSPCRRR